MSPKTNWSLWGAKLKRIWNGKDKKTQSSPVRLKLQLSVCCIQTPVCSSDRRKMSPGVRRFTFIVCKVYIYMTLFISKRSQCQGFLDIIVGSNLNQSNYTSPDTSTQDICCYQMPNWSRCSAANWQTNLFIVKYNIWPIPVLIMISVFDRCTALLFVHISVLSLKYC